MEKWTKGWRGWGELAPWFAMEALLPGAALFALLLWLSQRFVREGFREMRQYAFAPVGQWTMASTVKKNWWSCTCKSVGSCHRIADTAARAVRRCCMKFLRLGTLHENTFALN